MLLQQAYLLELHKVTSESVRGPKVLTYLHSFERQLSSYLLVPQDQASSELIKNKIEHASRSETKPTTATSITGRKDFFDLEDLAQLVCLALSDYAVWADVDLRRKIDWGNNQDHYNDDTELIHEASIDENNGCTFFSYNLN
jgi:hypothetical protein